MMKKIKSKRTIALLSMTAAFALTAGLGAAFLPRTSARAAELTEKTVDFTTDDGGTFEAAASTAGWKAERGVYTPVAAKAVTSTKDKIDLTKTTYISFDFYADTCPFDVLLAPDLTSWQGGFGVHIFEDNNGRLNVNSDLDAGVWKGDYANHKYYGDNTPHTMKIKIADNAFSVYMDDETDPITFSAVGSSISFDNFERLKTETNVSVFFRAADTESWIDNFIVSNSDIEYVPPVGPSEEEPEPPAGDVSVDLDFESDEGVSDVFATHSNGGWVVENGVYHASAAKAITKTNTAYDISETIYFSFDFYATATNFDVYFTPDLTTGYKPGGGFGIHLFSNNTLTVNAYMDQDVWIGEIGTNYVDGKAHNMKIKVENEAFTIYVDDGLISFNNGQLSSIPFASVKYQSGETTTEAFAESKTAQVCFQAQDTTSYIDNFKVSNGDIPYVAPAQPPEPPEERVEIELAFDGAEDDAYFMNALSSGGWKSAGNGGKFHPVAPWATTQLKQSIATNDGETYISFDFFAGEYDLSSVKSGWTWTNVQFNIALLPDLSQQNGGIGIHAYYADDSGTAVLTITDGLGRNWIADYPFDWHDNLEHNLKMKVAEGKVSFWIDNTQISATVDGAETTAFGNFTEDKVYFLMSSVSTMTSIDNFKLKFEDIAYTAPVQPELVPVEETFDEGSDAFEGGWNVADGVLNSSGWSLGWYQNRIPLTGSATIDFDFTASDTKNGSQFNFGLVRGTPQAAVVSNPSYSLHVYQSGETVSTKVSNWFGNPNDKNIDTINLNLFDGETHHVKMVVQGGKITIAIDNGILYAKEEKELPLDMDAAYFTVQAGDCTVTVDNFKLKSGAETLTRPDGSNDVTYENPSAANPDSAPVQADETKPDKKFMIGAILCAVAAAALLAGLAVVIFVRKR